MFSMLACLQPALAATTNYGFSIVGYDITSDNYASMSSGKAWSYDPVKNVLHLEEGTISPRGDGEVVAMIRINGNVNPSLSISVDGNCTLSGVYQTGLYFTGSGTHTIYGDGTLNIGSSKIGSTGISAGTGAKAIVMFQDLTVNIMSFQGIGFSPDCFASITFNHCEFNITTYNGMAMLGGADACQPRLILCQANRTWGSNNNSSGYKGNEADESLFAPSLKISRLINYVAVQVDEPVVGQKPSYTATPLSTEYEVSEVAWYQIEDNNNNRTMQPDEVFKVEYAYRVAVTLEAKGDNEFVSTQTEFIPLVATTVNGEDANYMPRSSKVASVGYTFYFYDTYDLWVAGTRVTRMNLDDVLGDGTVSFDPSGNFLKLNNANISSNGDYGIRSKLGYWAINLIGHNTITTDNVGIYVEKSNPTDDALTFLSFSADGSLDIKSNGAAALMSETAINLSRVHITAECTGEGSGVQGKRPSTYYAFPTLSILSEDATLCAKGGSEGSLKDFYSLSLCDGIEILEPAGATFEQSNGIVKDGALVANQWVIIGNRDYFDGIKEIDNSQQSTDNGTQSIYDLSGRKVTKPQKGIYIIAGKKVLIKE